MIPRYSLKTPFCPLNSFAVAMNSRKGKLIMKENLQETEITCPSCGFKMSGIIDEIPKNFVCQNCKIKFSIVAQIKNVS